MKVKAGVLAALGTVVFVAAAAPASAQTRACGPGELGDARVPAEADGESVGRVDRALVAGRRYRVERVIELAIGRYPDSSPYRQSNAKEGSIVVTAPPGVTLTELPETSGFRGGYEFTAPRARSLTLTVTWIQELQAQSGASAGECQATGTITLPIFTLQLARVSLVRYVRHRIFRVAPGQFAVSDDFFQLAVTPAAEPRDPAPIYVVLRVRRGRARAPSATGPVFRRVRLDRLRTINTAGMSVDNDFLEGPNDTSRPAVNVGLGAFVRQGQTVRFGFSIEITQRGRRLGGMRSGAICRIRFSSRANRRFRACTPIGFARRP
jgi:hypothetical protein